MQLGWSHPIMFSTCPPCCSCHGNMHWTFYSYGHLQAERVNKFRWNLVRNSKLGTQWQSRDQILKFLKFKMVDSRHVGKYSKCHNSPTNWPTVTQLVWSHPIMFSTCPLWCGCHGMQWRIEHSAVMGVWRPNTWTNFDEIWIATASSDHNHSCDRPQCHVIKY